MPGPHMCTGEPAWSHLQPEGRSSKTEERLGEAWIEYALRLFTMQQTDRASRWVQLLGRWSSKEIGYKKLDKCGKLWDPIIFTSSQS